MVLEKISYLRREVNHLSERVSASIDETHNLVQIKQRKKAELNELIEKQKSEDKLCVKK